MMIAVIADIHGNYPALAAVINEIDKLGCDKIISLGDVAGFYCMINECIELLRSRDVINIMGNHDDYLVNGTKCNRSRTVNECIQYQRNIINRDNLEWLAQSFNHIEFNEFSMVHGGWNDFLDEYIYEVSEDYFSNKEQQIFFSGHTHIQLFKEMQHIKYCNPGSVGQPRDGDWRAAYVLIEKKHIILKRVEYSVDSIAEAMKKANFSSYYYNNLYYGTRIGVNI